MLGKFAFLLQKFIKSELENQPQQLAQRAKLVGCNFLQISAKYARTQKATKKEPFGS